MKKRHDDESNAQYMNQWVQQTEEANRDRLTKENNRKKQVLAN